MITSLNLVNNHLIDELCVKIENALSNCRQPRKQLFSWTCYWKCKALCIHPKSSDTRYQPQRKLITSLKADIISSKATSNKMTFTYFSLFRSKHALQKRSNGTKNT